MTYIDCCVYKRNVNYSNNLDLMIKALRVEMFGLGTLKVNFTLSAEY